MTKRTFVTTLTLFTLLGAFACTLEATDRKGIVRERPAEGRFVELPDGYFMVPYTDTIPGTDITFEMVPIPGGEFRMGSPEDEADREDDEGPQFTVTVDPFWMGKHEVTWREYQHFMDLYHIIKERPAEAATAVTEDNFADTITIPTPLYDADKTYERGADPNHPAVTMTPLAARQYTKWLSLLSGRFHRLPSEAEWEYACRAGTSTAFSFGDDPDELEAYGWFFDNSLDEDKDLEVYWPVGSLKPNPWGLYDMHGNVSELVLDEYRADHYQQFDGKTVHWLDAVAWPTRRTERVHRGGSWDSDPEHCRSAARDKTDDSEWKINDPNLPRSPWWYTTEEARRVGFRLVRPLEAPETSEDRNRFWEEDGVEEVAQDVDQRLREGRAARTVIAPQK